MTIADKLTYLNDTKSLMRTGLNQFGSGITTADTFRSYAAKIDEIYENWTKLTDEGTNLTFTPTKKARMINEPTGFTSQETTTGKNFINNFRTTTTTTGLTFTVNEDGSVSVNGTATADTTFITCDQSQTQIRANLLNKSLILTGCPSGGSNTTYWLQTWGYGGTTVVDTGNGTNPFTFTNESGNWNVAIRIASGVICNNLTFKPMVRLSSITDDTYEPYTNGASPNPDYPQNIVNATGISTLKVIGKNLFDKENANILNANLGYGQGNYGRISSSANARTLYIPIKSNTTYTVSKISSQRFVIGTINEIPATGKICNNIVYTTIGSTFLTITSGANDTYLCVYYYLNGTDTLTEQQILDSIQIEQSLSATTYEAYKEQSYTINLGSIELCKIGTYKDRIYNSGGKWYLEKNIGKVVLNGSEEWNSETAYTGYYRYILLTLGALNTNNGLNNRFTQRISQAHGGYEYLFVQMNNGAIHIQLLQSRLSSSSTTDFKTWLSNNNVTVYYVLATPTTEEITSSNYPTLYNQLNTLYNAKSYDGTTNIIVTGTTPANIKASALLKGGN